MPIVRCEAKDFKRVCDVINDAAEAYKGVIPRDCWKEPYMSREELRREIQHGVVFWGYRREASAHELVGVMGLQDLEEVTLVRHAYVRNSSQNQGIGSVLLSHVLGLATHPVLVGTWADASWAIRFYEKHGFNLIGTKQKDELLKRYWTVPKRQAVASVVLANRSWFETSIRLPKSYLDS